MALSARRRLSRVSNVKRKNTATPRNATSLIAASEPCRNSAMLVNVGCPLRFSKTSTTMMSTTRMPSPANARSGRWGLESQSDKPAACSLTDRSAYASPLKPDPGKRCEILSRDSRQVSTILTGSRLLYTPSASTGGAGRRTPLGAIRFFLEVRARDERLLQVLGIVDDGGHREPLVAVRLGVAIVVFGQDRALTVGHAILPEISSLQVRRDDFQRATLRRRRAAASGCAAPAARTRITGSGRVVSALSDAASGDDTATAAAAAAWRSARDFPRRRRIALPARFSFWRLRLAEAQQTGLLTGVHFDLQRIVVLPGEVDAAGHAHDVRRTVRLALIAARHILRRITRVDDLAALVVQRHAREIAFRGSDKPIAPVFRDHGHPVAGEIDRRPRPGGRRNRRRAAAAALSIDGSRGRQAEPDDSDPSGPNDRATRAPPHHWNVPLHFHPSDGRRMLRMRRRWSCGFRPGLPSTIT